ncbi:putative chemoreceptor glutamine deamidase CheD [Gammaproteobacteria bacterium]
MPDQENLCQRLGRPLPGFEHINRYWDRQHDMPASKILPGEYYVTLQEEIIATVLGSCVSACVRDPNLGMGAMNHFMLPSSEGQVGWAGDASLTSHANRYGNHAMEHMINDMLKNGAKRKYMEVKIIGGGQIIQSNTQIGLRNIEFIRQYLTTEGLHLVGEDVGDIYPRKVLYFPTTGRVRVKKLEKLHNDTVLLRERAYQRNLQEAPVEGSIELF